MWLNIVPTARKDNMEHKRVPMEVYDTPMWPWSRVHLDLATELPITAEGFTMVLVAKCALTKWVEFIPIRGRTMLDVAKGFTTIVSTWGVPDLIIKDRGTEFVNILMRNVREILQYKHVKTTAQNPQGNGQAEAVMKTLKTALSAYVRDNQRDWSDYLSLVKLSINGSVSTVTGYTPHFLMTGREMASPTLTRVKTAQKTFNLDEYTSRLAEAIQYIWEGVSEAVMSKAAGLSMALGIMAEEFRAYSNGDFVFVRRVPRRFYTDERELLRYNITAKLQRCRYTGAHKIIAKISPTTYIVDVHNVPRTIHVRHMKPAGRISVQAKYRMQALERRRGLRLQHGLGRPAVELEEEAASEEAAAQTE
jgi:hypothetical protein